MGHNPITDLLFGVLLRPPFWTKPDTPNGRSVMGFLPQQGVVWHPKRQISYGVLCQRWPLKGGAREGNFESRWPLKGGARGGNFESGWPLKGGAREGNFESRWPLKGGDRGGNFESRWPLKGGDREGNFESRWPLKGGGRKGNLRDARAAQQRFPFIFEATFWDTTP